MEKLYTCEEVAEIFKVETDTVYSWIRTGRLKKIELSYHNYRISESEINRFLKAKAST